MGFGILSLIPLLAWDPGPWLLTLVLKLPKDLGCILLQSHIRRKKEPTSKSFDSYAVSMQFD